MQQRVVSTLWMLHHVSWLSLERQNILLLVNETSRNINSCYHSHLQYNNPHSSANPNSQRHSQSSSPHNGVPSALSSPSGTSTGLLLSSPILSPDKVKFKQELTQLSELYAQAITSKLYTTALTVCYWLLHCYRRWFGA